MEKQAVPISQLSPSAARLLLALVTAQENELFDQTMMRAGIQSLKTYWKAKSQLIEGKYMIVEQGKLKASLSPR